MKHEIFARRLLWLGVAVAVLFGLGGGLAALRDPEASVEAALVPETGIRTTAFAVG